MNEQTVDLVKAGRRHRRVLSWWPGPPYRLQLDGPGRRYEAVGPDLFEALVNLRRRLEVDGWLLAVQGARRDAYPSGMARDMADGRQVYLNRLGSPAVSADLVDTLAATDDLDCLATVDEQSRWHLAWLES